MKTTREHHVREQDAPTCLTTTIYDLMTALQTVVAPHEDALVVALVSHWLQTGRITLLNKATARRRLQCRATMAQCRWGFHPPLTTGYSMAGGDRTVPSRARTSRAGRGNIVAPAPRPFR